MNNEDLGPQPEPVIEDGEPNPGGADAVSEDPADNGLGRDLHPEANPGVDDALPDEIGQLDEDKKQAPEGEADDQEAGTQEDVEAGQESEDGSVEPPA